MSPLRLTGSTSGYSQIDAPAVAGDQTFTLPGTGGTLATTNAGSVTTTMLADSVPVAKAWVNFNGTGTVAIRASYNVSSITDGGVGIYTVNFTSALSDTNYSVVASPSKPGGSVSGTNSAWLSTGEVKNTSNVLIESYTLIPAYIDSPNVHVAVFR